MTQDEKLSQIARFERERLEYDESLEGKAAIAANESRRKSDHNGMGYWFPRIESAGLPVPRTILVVAPDDLIRVCDGEKPEGYDEFVAAIRLAGDALSWPCFLRTEHGSGKHSWERTCHLPSPTDIRQHVYNLVEWSECVDFCGLSYCVWAVRELLPTIPVGHCTRYSNMPICREIRVFTKAGKVACCHPYWPSDSLGDGEPDCDEPTAFSICAEPTPEELNIISPLSEHAASVCPDDDWSIDFLWTAKGWFLTDMAISARSWHWPTCPNAE